MKTKHLLAYGLTAAAAVTILSGCAHHTMRGGQTSTVTVSGVGTVSVVPDMVNMNISMNKTDRTTTLAQSAVNAMSGRALAILKESGIEDKDIRTASLRFNPEYEWSNGRSILTGQRAEQSINVAVRGIGQDAKKLARIIDRLAEIDGIVLNNIDFGIADNAGNFVDSRKLAFEKALQKAQLYAELSGLKVGRVLSLTEDGATEPTPLYRGGAINQTKMEASFDAGAASTMLPSGQMDVTSRISVTFLLE